MEFCKKCGSILRPEKKGSKVVLVCKRCNKKFEGSKAKNIVIGESGESSKEIVSIGKRELEKELPKIEIECPKCGNKEAYWWSQQTRSTDEPPTLFYKCVKCSYTWRSYS